MSDIFVQSIEQARNISATLIFSQRLQISGAVHIELLFILQNIKVGSGSYIFQRFHETQLATGDSSVDVLDRLFVRVWTNYPSKLDSNSSVVIGVQIPTSQTRQHNLWKF